MGEDFSILFLSVGRTEETSCQGQLGDTAEQAASGRHEEAFVKEWLREAVGSFC